MKVLVVGGAGYIGSHVCWAFNDRGDEVAVLDNFFSGNRANVPDGIRVIEGDLLDAPLLMKVLKEGWDGVLHLAAFKAAGESMLVPEKYAANNLCGTINLLGALCEAGTPPLVFSSSAAIFGEPQILPIDEDHPKNPTNFYGFTKLEIERLFSWYERLRGLRFASLRYFNAAGYEARVRNPETNPANLLPVMMETAAGIRKELVIFGDDYPTPDGTCIRDYIHVIDLVDAHLRAMDFLVAGGENLYVNLGSGKGVSVTTMMKETLRITGENFEWRVGPRRPGDPAELVASADRAAKILGWKAVHSTVGELVASTWEIYKNLNPK